MQTPTLSHARGTVQLRDGTVAHLRCIDASDAAALRAFHARLSPESVYFRFFALHPALSDKEVEHFTHVDGHSRVAIVAEVDDRLVAVGRYEGSPGRNDAEVAFVVEDRYQGCGIAGVLLQHLARIARRQGIDRFTADTLFANRRMLHVFAASGFEQSLRLEAGVVRITLQLDAPTAPPPTAMTFGPRDSCPRSRRSPTTTD